MECPECKEIMENIYCEKCGTQARLTWTPGKRVNNKADEIAF